MKLKKMAYKFALAVAGVCMLASCAQTTGGNKSKGDSKPNETEHNPLVEAAETLSIKNKVCENEDKIELPNSLPGFEGVSITWKSKNTGIIEEDGNVKHKEGTGVDKVILTAILIKDNYKVVKDFVVSVRQRKFLGTVKKERTKIDFYNDYFETDCCLFAYATSAFEYWRFSYRKDSEGYLLLKLMEMYPREDVDIEARWYTPDEYRNMLKDAGFEESLDNYNLWCSEERTKEFNVKYDYDKSSKNLNFTSVFTPGLKINEQRGKFISENKKELLDIFGFVKLHGGFNREVDGYKNYYHLTFNRDYTNCKSGLEHTDNPDIKFNGDHNFIDDGNWILNFDATSGAVTIAGGLNKESYNLNFIGIKLF